jgi:hypothetical protein
MTATHGKGAMKAFKYSGVEDTYLVPVVIPALDYLVWAVAAVVLCRFV